MNRYPALKEYNIIKFLKTYKTVLLGTLFIFILSESIVAFGVYIMYEKDKKSHLDEVTSALVKHVKMSNITLSDVSQIFYDTSVNDEQTQRIMAEASQTNDKNKLEELRDKLYKKHLSLYRYMQNYKVRQFHFHLPNTVSFLRFHRPDKFGDSLKGIRYSIEYVNRKKSPILGFEEGRIFNGFRNVYPIFYKKIFVGSVEISYPFQDFQSELLILNFNSHLILIKDNVVREKVFKNEQENYLESEFDSYSYDKAALQTEMYFDVDKLREINTLIANKALEKMNKKRAFSLSIQKSDLLDNRRVIITFLPVLNLQNEPIAYMLSYAYADNLETLFEKIKLIFIVLSALVFFMSLTLFYLGYKAKKKELRIHAVSIHDPLTKIFNRRGGHTLLKQTFSEFIRYKSDTGIIYFDIDHFKKINDTYGHEKGDYVLRTLAELFTKSLRESDIFVRWGGEEFLIILPKTNLKNSVQVAETLRQNLENYTFNGVEKVTSSFGVSVINPQDTKKTLFIRVDKYLYRAKRDGRNQVVSDLT